MAEARLISEVLSIHELSAYLNIPVRTLYQMAGEGTIPGTKIGKHWRFSREGIDRWLQRRSARRQTLLVVDDDPLVGQLFADVFADDGYTVVVAGDTAAARQLIREQEFSTVFLDVVMPGVSGAALLTEIRQLKPTQHVILMTAYPASELVAEALRHGPVTLLQKPFSIQHLRATLRAMSL